MDLSGPKRPSWWFALTVWIGVIIGVVAILAYILPIAALSSSAFWLLTIGWLLLAGVAALIYLRLVK